MSEFDCLHVNVTVPENVPSERKSKSKRLLPVMVWIHGGGLAMGSNSWPQYSLTNLVSLSSRLGHPIIGVNINYRTNVLGFLCSSELGATGNYGFKDQVLALKWVRKHIAGFGGDPENVTAMGESAGSISLSTILCSSDADEKLWDRVVLMSGEVTLRKPRGRMWHEEMYQEQVRMLGLEGCSREERASKLKGWDAVDLARKLPLAQHFCGVVDGQWLRGDVRLGDFEKGKGVHEREWCEEFVMGDTGDDVSIPLISLSSASTLSFGD